MELRHVRDFVAVAGELHLRRAESLHVAPSALSARLREPRVQLLDRTTRNVLLSDAGVTVLETRGAACCAKPTSPASQTRGAASSGDLVAVSG